MGHKTNSSVMKEINTLNPDFTISMHREKALDGRNGMGAGYIIAISDGKTYHIAEYNNSRHNGEKKPVAETALGCLVSDAMAYEYSKNIDNFYNEYGYSSVSEGIKAYNACKKTAEALQAMFPDGKLEKLYKILDEAGY